MGGFQDKQNQWNFRGLGIDDQLELLQNLLSWVGKRPTEVLYGEKTKHTRDYGETEILLSNTESMINPKIQ